MLALLVFDLEPPIFWSFVSNTGVLRATYLRWKKFFKALSHCTSAWAAYPSIATAGRDTEQTDLKTQNPHCPQRADLVLCGHSFGVSVARSFAQHLEVVGVRLRGLIAFDQRIRTALDLLPAFPQSHHFSASFCRLSLQ